MEREVLNIVVVGHVDHGKSTVIGRLLYDTQSLPEGAIDRVKRIAKEKGKPFEYAYLLDAFEEEQKQGITIDTTQLQFRTEKRDYVIIDAPGHKEFLKNMISGAASAEAALLIIDANEGIQEQSKRHGYLLSLLGIQKAYVLINKMDLINYSEAKFNEIRREMNEFLHNLHVFPLKYIPISAFFGENMVAPSEKMPWYKGEPILKAIDLFEKDKGLETKPLRFPIQDVYKFDNRRIIAGRIETGTLQLGDEILISPSNKLTKVKTIEYWADKDKTDSIYAGMSVGITVEDEFFNQRGEFIVHPNQAPLTADTCKANIFWMGKKELVKGREYKLKLATQEVECEIHSIVKVIDATTLATVENASQVKTNDVAEVIIRTKKQLCFDEFKNNQLTGRFVIVDGYDVSGGGIVSGLVKELQAVSKLIGNGLELVVNCFDDYFYVLSESTVRKLDARPHTFSVGDVVAVAGKTYEYPEDFDIIDLRSKVAAYIRKARVVNIVKLNEYVFAGVPAIDSKGAYLRIETKENFDDFLNEFKEINDWQGKQASSFTNKWFEFTTYRNIPVVAALKTAGPDYQI
ncbi:sulfate adenylyltransferase subunit 1 [Sporomusa sp. KB1]|jgi:bifunctional enzyme CysN/CysC/sulfate adenylyltransferase subunit 1|uniref:sulfate adenylyltransferase subunit 1 n=1 Tax=Sporomusa sp. KB1 TaxID=943346 RepID=UPI0021033C0F|nr:GTP-binding protein [Sporomusa sp. KB1]